MFTHKKSIAYIDINYYNVIYSNYENEKTFDAPLFFVGSQCSWSIRGI